MQLFSLSFSLINSMRMPRSNSLTYVGGRWYFNVQGIVIGSFQYDPLDLSIAAGREESLAAYRCPAGIYGSDGLPDPASPHHGIIDFGGLHRRLVRLEGGDVA